MSMTRMTFSLCLGVWGCLTWGDPSPAAAQAPAEPPAAAAAARDVAPPPATDAPPPSIEPASNTAASTPAAQAAQAMAGAVGLGKRILGAVTEVACEQSELVFAARVDTGATTCSVHVEKWEISDESAEMAENVGKQIRFFIKNHRDDGQWVVSKIVELATIKTSEREEQRYKVPMTLVCQGVKKEVLVSLNDRAHMQYPMLVGRNFLQDDFLVDVSAEQTPADEAGATHQVADRAAPATERK
jgi:hypothetical protein